MKQVKTEFTRHGYTHTQVERNEVAAIYKLTEGDRVAGFEVIVIRKHKRDQMIFSTQIREGDEIFPGKSMWGYLAWSLHTFDQALAKYMEVSKEERKRLSEVEAKNPV